MSRIKRKFYNRPTLQVARDLIGQLLVRKWRGKISKYIITETEAYIGQNDPACHAARGMTPRNQVMFGPPGHAYVYFIYGMYFCLNIVTEKEGFPAAVLIRGLVPEPLSPQEGGLYTSKGGIGLSLQKEGLYDGPGKLCRELKITKDLNGADVVQGDKLWVESGKKKLAIKRTPRIGIKQGQDKLWRFLAK